MSADDELLARVSNTKNSFSSLLYGDELAEWTLAKEFAEFLVRILPDDIMGHVFLARAHRHLGDLKRARAELKHCRLHVERYQLKSWEKEDFLPILEKEENLLRGGGTEPKSEES